MVPEPIHGTGTKYMVLAPMHGNHGTYTWYSFTVMLGVLSLEPMYGIFDILMLKVLMAPVLGSGTSWYI